MTQKEFEAKLREAVANGDINESSLDGSVTLAEDGWVDGMISLLGVPVRMVPRAAYLDVTEDEKTVLFNLLEAAEAINQANFFRTCMPGVLDNDKVKVPFADLIKFLDDLIDRGIIWGGNVAEIKTNADRNLAEFV